MKYKKECLPIQKKAHAFPMRFLIKILIINKKTNVYI